MDTKRVLLIGLPSPDESMRAAGFFSNINLHEINTIIWNPATLHFDLIERFSISNLESLDFVLADNMYNALEHRLNFLVTWVERGHALVVLTCRPLRLIGNYPTHEKKVHPLGELAPFNWATWIPASGRLIEFCGPEPTREFLQWLLDDPHYEIVLGKTDLSPLLRVSTTQPVPPQLVGGYRRVGAGIVAFVPSPNWDEYDPNTGELQAVLEDLAELPAQLREGDPQLPAWADAYCLPDEADARAKITQIESEIANSRNLIEEKSEVIAAAQPPKHLFAGTGESFAHAVKQALEDFGLKVVEGPKFKADLLVWDGERLAAVEAKGINGSVKDGNLRQCERWRLDVMSTLGNSPESRERDPDLKEYARKLSELGVPLDNEKSPADCKGIMVIGTFRDTPLQERTKRDFPDPVARRVARSAVCGLTGLQLLGLVLEARTDPARRKEIVDAFFTTNGALKEAESWNTFLKTPSEVGSE